MPPVVILAGGLATRLYPTTRTLPKSLIEVAGRPFIYHQLDLLKEQGVQRIVLCVGKFGEMVEESVGTGNQWGLDIRYSYDGELLLGTGGAIKNALHLLPEEFMILYGDSYLDTNLDSVYQAFRKQNLPIMMTVFKNKNLFDSSNISMKEGRIVEYNKKIKNTGMEYIDYGLMVVKKEIFNSFPSGVPFDLADLLSKFVNQGSVAAFVIDERFHEIGSLEGIAETSKYISDRKGRCNDGR